MTDLQEGKRKWGYYLLFSLGLLLLLHVLVIAGVIPSDAVWAGWYIERSELIKMEGVAVVIVLLAGVVVAEYSGLIQSRLPSKLTKAGMYILLVLFAMSTIGSATSAQPLERYIFSSFALWLAYCIYKVISAK